MVATAVPPTYRTSLAGFYFLRAGVAAVWVALAATIGTAAPMIGAALLVLYPAWDALANALDAHSNGGFGANASQTLNLAVSALVAPAVAIALAIDMRLVLGLFGGWAIFAGLLQLITGARRWRAYGAQWPMILSGAQSALAGTIFIKQATGPATSAITTVAPYAAFGAFYFLVSAVALTLKERRASSKAVG